MYSSVVEKMIAKYGVEQTIQMDLYQIVVLSALKRMETNY